MFALILYTLLPWLLNDCEKCKPLAISPQLPGEANVAFLPFSNRKLRTDDHRSNQIRYATDTECLEILADRA
ncbi:hypothetical protein BJ875DRAFT_469975 [Amylocarpus encephaloides]|uniref:Uncharacterized protein n=1 Tax=Amylocarpus encephaloides TaxID=45428 RepID=A0A9P8C2R1_9HELO|nr:hypothetical protein BJ875DRAFT_469975 [Amylocarpus encephaloides]